MLNQTKAARDFLLGLGLTREQFSVKCQRIKKGRRNDHGLVEVTLYIPLGKQLALAPKLAEYFSVQVVYDEGQPFYVLVMEPGIERGPFGYQYKWEKGLHIERRPAGTGESALKLEQAEAQS